MARTMHLSAFSETMQAPLTLSQINAVADPPYNIQNGTVFVPESRTVVAQYAAGVGLTVAQISSASLIMNGRPTVYPIDGDASGGNLAAWNFLGPNGYTIPALEQFEMLLTIGGVANSLMMGGVWHTNGIKPIMGGPIRTVRATAACAGAAGAWQPSPLVFDTALSRGTYNVVGMAVEGANLLFGRLFFVNQTDRPGVLGSTGPTIYQWDFFRYGKMGVFGTFDNYNPPSLECLGTGTLTTQTVFLDLQQIS